MLNAAFSAPGRNRSSLALEQASAALCAGDPVDAERTLRAHLLAVPNDPAALARLAEILVDGGRLREAILLLRRALQADPAAHQARLALAGLLQGQAQPHQALEQIEQLPPAIRNRFDVQTSEAALLGILGRHDPEIAIYHALVKLQPEHPGLWMSLGNALKYAGRSDDAVAALRRAIKIRPAYGEGWWSLANIKTAKFDDRDLKAMRKALRGRPTGDDALHLHFALGKALEDRGDHAESFRHYAAGNQIRAAALTPAQMSATAFVTEALATFDATLFTEAARGDESTDPIFVVGLQRSGSTLIEQILASHPLIEGTSELPAMQQLWMEAFRDAQAAGTSLREHLRHLGEGRLRAMGAEYLDRARPFRSTGKPHFVDKLPANWMNVGLIRLILPNARIIDARRHPLACGFSNFKQHYATGVAFAYSQQSIGRFYNDYLRTMRHFDRVQPGAVHLAINERLIEDTEGEVRRLLDHVGVPFDPACLEFYRNRRSVNTPSAEQVRRPINRDGIDRWRQYDQWLGPMKQALGAALHDWDSPVDQLSIGSPGGS